MLFRICNTTVAIGEKTSRLFGNIAAKELLEEIWILSHHLLPRLVKERLTFSQQLGRLVLYLSGETAAPGRIDG